MESLWTIFSRLSSAASTFLYLRMYVGMGGFMLFFFVTAALEREILKLSISRPHFSAISWLCICVNMLIFVLLVVTFMANLLGVRLEAMKLSPTFRAKRIKAIKTSLKAYDVDVGAIVNNIAESRKRRTRTRPDAPGLAHIDSDIDSKARGAT